MKNFNCNIIFGGNLFFLNDNNGIKYLVFKWKSHIFYLIFLKSKYLNQILHVWKIEI
jgi:hypothetical protein